MQISTAWAQTAGGGADPQSWIGFAPLVIIPIIFYFLLFRPQQQRASELKQQQEGLRRGDRVVTAGGIIGMVTKVIDAGEVEVEIASSVRVRVLKNTISTVLAKTQPASKETPDPGETPGDEPAETTPRRRGAGPK